MKHVMRGVAGFVCLFSCAVVVHAGTTMQDVGEGSLFMRLTETLLTRGIIPESYGERARGIARAVARIDTYRTSEDERVSPHVAVSVSQLIEFSDRTYAAGVDVEGLIVLVKNRHTEGLELTVDRTCPIQYRIYDEDQVMVFDSTVSPECSSSEMATYYLQSGQTRMFAVTHPHERFPLTSGTYRFALEYPMYGGGDLVITVR